MRRIRKRKIKRSISRALILVFTGALIIALIGCAYFSFRNSDKMEMDRTQSLSSAAFDLTKMSLDFMTYDTLDDGENEKAYKRLRKFMHKVCSSLNLKYLYIYEPLNDHDLKYLCVVASDPEMNDQLETERAYGTVLTNVLGDEERAAMRGAPMQHFYVDTEYGQDIVWVEPYTNEKTGEVLALICADVDVLSNSLYVLSSFFETFIPIGVVLLIVFIATYLMVQVRVIRPLKLITLRIKNYDPEEEQTPLVFTSEDEMQAIAEAFEELSAETLEYIEKVKTITAEREQTKAEMDVARRIQYGMTPAESHVLQNNIDMSARMLPAKEVGGDFYDGFFLDEDRYCGIIGDVSGKGIAGAMFMVLAKQMLLDALRGLKDPARAVNIVNDRLCEQNPEGLFVTIFVFVINIKTGEMVFANAGHNPPVFIRGDEVSFLECEPGIVLGLFEDSGITNTVINIESNEGFVLYTDGITEAVSPADEFFGEDKLVSVVQDNKSGGSAAAADAVINTVEEFFKGRDQFDDMTVMVTFFLS